MCNPLILCNMIHYFCGLGLLKPRTVFYIGASRCTVVSRGSLFTTYRLVRNGVSLLRTELNDLPVRVSAKTFNRI